VAEDIDARCRMSSTLHEFYDAQGTALDGEAHGLWHGHRLSAAGPSQIQIHRSPSSSQGPKERGQGGRAPSCTGRGRTPSGQAAMSSNTKSRLQRPSQELRFARRLTTARASRLYTSTCGLIT
jgi:hypothetical protein